MQHLHLPWAAPHRPTPQTTQRNHHFAVVTQRSPQLHHLQQRGSCLPARASRREPKDPSSFRDMDEARAYLHSTANGGSVGPISGALNWLSNAAFGAGRAGAHIGAWYRHWLSQSQHSSSRCVFVGMRRGSVRSMFPLVKSCTLTPQRLNWAWYNAACCFGFQRAAAAKGAPQQQQQQQLCPQPKTLPVLRL